MIRTINHSNVWFSPARLNILAQGMILLVFASILAKGFFFSPEYLFYRYDDDFYYYIGIAQHLSQDLVSSFNGVHLSNGYHPLWMVVLTFLLKVFPYESVGFHLTLTLVIIGSFAITIRLMDSIFDFFDIPVWVRILYLAIFFYASRLLYFGAMEVILTIPLGLYLLNYYLKKEKLNFVLLGFLSSMLILSRLDSIFLVLFLLIQIAASYRFAIRDLIKPMLLFGAGGIALPIYLASNLYFFDSFLPLSGMAKQLRVSRGFSFRPFIDWVITPYPYRLILLAAWIGEIGALAYLLATYRKLDAISKKSLPFLTFSLVFFFVHGYLSDWHWWPWYLYPVILSMPLLLIAGWNTLQKSAPIWKRIRPLGLAWVSLIPCILLLLYGTYNLTTPTRVSTHFKEVKAMADYLNKYEGVNVGIGDAAGIVYMLLNDSNKLIQLEGLVMDKPYLQFLETQPSQEEVFSAYNIRFYIMLNPEKKADNCYHSFFPKQAGDKSIRIPTQYCMKPVFAGEHFVAFDRMSDESEVRLTQRSNP